MLIYKKFLVWIRGIISAAGWHDRGKLPLQPMKTAGIPVFHPFWLVLYVIDFKGFLQKTTRNSPDPLDSPRFLYPQGEFMLLILNGYYKNSPFPLVFDPTSIEGKKSGEKGNSCIYLNKLFQINKFPRKKSGEFCKNRGNF